uniref:Cecropin-B-like n=1 Tax=Meloidogyne hapla TaxID=6305 RepID=A0A1I8BI27_MELHA
MFKDFANVPSAAFIIPFLLTIATIQTAPTNKEDQLFKSGSEKAKNGLENLGKGVENIADGARDTAIGAAEKLGIYLKIMGGPLIPFDSAE